MEHTIPTSILKTVEPHRYQFMKSYQICLKINMSDRRYYQHNKNIPTEVYIPITTLQ